MRVAAAVIATLEKMRRAKSSCTQGVLAEAQTTKGRKEKSMSDEPRATIYEIGGQLVLDDPDALAVARAVEKHNCNNTYELNEDRVEHFCGRIKERGLSVEEVVIVIINVDDPHGGPITEMLMPDQEAMWQKMRDQGMVPFARGLVGREGIQSVLETFDKEAAEKLAEVQGDAAVVVVDHGVAEIYNAEMM